jgi:hypothetical protein
LQFDVVNSENIWTYFDQECGVEEEIPMANRTYLQNQMFCHWTEYPNVTCREALTNVIGTTHLRIKWQRIEWNETIAKEYRYGKMTSPTADLEAYELFDGDKSHQKFRDDINIGYKYFSSDHCVTLDLGMGRGCIDKPGWRQLFRFSSSNVNKGKEVVHLGDVFVADYQASGLFEYDRCHKHFHFQHFEQYIFGPKHTRKNGWCLQTTSRYYNNEWVPFSTPYSYCWNQGVCKYYCICTLLT